MGGWQFNECCESAQEMPVFGSATRDTPFQLMDFCGKPALFYFGVPSSDLNRTVSGDCSMVLISIFRGTAAMQSILVQGVIDLPSATY